MTKLGTRQHPIVVRVRTDEHGQYIAQECEMRGWQYIIGLEPDKPEDISDFEKARNPSVPMQSDKIGRNEPCPCGSGKKFKKCCASAVAHPFSGTAQRYHPEIAPDPEEWLALDEGERTLIVEDYHRSAHIELPNATVHALIQVVVENQIAERLDPVVRAMARLRKEGLARHDALHAIGSVVAEHLFDAMNSKDPALVDSVGIIYAAAVERLTAREWRQRYQPMGVF